MATLKREHITPVLAELHWLPVAARINFKIAVITFNLLTTIADDLNISASWSATHAFTDQLWTCVSAERQHFEHLLWPLIPQNILLFR